MIGFQIRAKHEGEPEARDREGQVNFEEVVVRRLKGLLSSKQTFYLGKSR